MLEKIFSVKNKDIYKVITIFGKQINIKSGKRILLKLIADNLIIKQKLDAPQITYKFLHNKHLMATNYYNDFCNKDIVSKYIKLISGLDEKSLIVLNRTLSRILNWGRYRQDTFLISKEEFEDLYNIDIINGQIYELSNGIYSINNYMIADKIFCPISLYDKYFIDEIIDKNKIEQNDIIDAGAFVGDTALVFASYTKGKIHSFEPDITNFSKLKKTIEINKLNNVIPINMGIGAQECEMDFYSTGFSAVSSFQNDSLIFEQNGCSKYKVQITTIDRYVQENNIKVGLIKTDVEGFEQDLLKGAIETIKRDKPVLMISIYHTFDDFWNIKPLIESLDLGYKFSIRKSAGNDICCDLILIAEVPAGKD